jgi:CPA1 family monovalent cation:H+ antiporter
LAKLEQKDNFPEIDAELFRYKQELVQGQLSSVKDKLQSLMQNHPQLKEVAAQKFDTQLLDIEAETYAELIREGRLDENLAPVLITLVTEPDPS